MNGSVTISLPHGFSVNGTHSRVAGLRRLTDEEQLFLAEECQSLPSAVWTTEALAHCVTRLGERASPDRQSLRDLTVGDRDALLLHLHALCFGESLNCEARCPAPGCAEKLDLRLAVNDLLVPAYPRYATEHELRIPGSSGDSARVRFRLPTGADHETAAEVGRSDLNAGVSGLMQSCVKSVERAGDPAADTAISPLGSFEREISERMAELDPQAELLLRADCPSCGCAFRARFDVAAFLRQRFDERAQALYREVHLLAFHYHWSAHDILGMRPGVRQRYLQLLRTELAQGALQ